jgi:cell shape-determining protein MreC
MLQLFYNRYSNAVYLNTDISIYLLVIMMLIIMFFDSHVQASSVKNTKVLWHVKYLGQDYLVKRSVMRIHLLQ